MSARVTVPVEPEFTHYRRSQIAHLRPYVAGETLSDRVSISAADLEAGSPKPGDMIARNPANHDDQWLVAAEYFAANFEPVSAAPAPEGGAWTLDDMRELVSDEQVRHLVSATDVAQGRIRLRDILNALATREEAPADNVTILITRAQREAAKNSGKKLNDWIGGILQRAVEEAPAEHHERNLAMTNAELIEQALSHPPLEAPAEAGEREAIARIIATQTFDLLANYTSIDRGDGLTPDQREPSVLKAYPTLETDREQALAKADEILALRAQPPAREEAQPVGWISEHVLHRMGRMDHEMIYGDKKAADYQGDAVAVYTTPPAPEAEKLRALLTEIRDTVQITRARHLAAEALAALQAEQGAK